MSGLALLVLLLGLARAAADDDYADSPYRRFGVVPGQEPVEAPPAAEPEVVPPPAEVVEAVEALPAEVVEPEVPAAPALAVPATPTARPTAAPRPAGPDPVVPQAGPARRGDLPAEGAEGRRGTVRAPRGALPWSLAISPYHLLLPMVELTAEVGLAPGVSGALVAGYGSSNDYRALNAGAQVRGALLGDFRRGISLGAEYLASVRTADLDGTRVQGTTHTVGPMLGAKYSLGFGLMAEVQGGLAYVAAPVRVKNSDFSGFTAGWTVAPTGNLTVVWTF